MSPVTKIFGNRPMYNWILKLRSKSLDSSFQIRWLLSGWSAGKGRSVVFFPSKIAELIDQFLYISSLINFKGVVYTYDSVEWSQVTPYESVMFIVPLLLYIACDVIERHTSK